MKKIIIIGSGFSGLSAACFVAKAGYEVLVLEKHDMPGGRARVLKEDGFVFDMGPSWYWMPDVFERFFNCFGKKVSDYYRLERLDPSYRIYWPDEVMDIPADYNQLLQLFEKKEAGLLAASETDDIAVAEMQAWKDPLKYQKQLLQQGRRYNEMFTKEK